MNILVAMDSFKGSLTSLQAGTAAAAGILQAMPDAQVTVRPFADGGEGTAETLTAALSGETVQVQVTGPLGEPQGAAFGILPGGTAVLGMASAAGLPLVPPSRRDPRHTTTFGVGEMILHGLDRGCRRFLVGIGGSATNDGGAGMLQALGFSLCDGAGNPIPPGAAGLAVLEQVSPQGADPRLAQAEFVVACDVENPLCGAQGCSAVFGPQKGATPETVAQMDGWLERYAQKVQGVFPAADPNRPGAGAAGGLGFAFQSFLHARLESGMAMMIRELGLEAALENADVLVTGEGRMDGQTAMGKGPVGLARRAAAQGKPCVALVGSVGEGAEHCLEAGVTAIFPVVAGACTLQQAMEPKTAAENVTRTAQQVFRLWRRGK